MSERGEAEERAGARREGAEREREEAEREHWQQLGRLLNHPPEVLALLREVERTLAGHPAATVQRTLACALWRVTCRQEPYCLQSDRIAEAIVLREGGREVCLQVQMLTAAAREQDE